MEVRTTIRQRVVIVLAVIVVSAAAAVVVRVVMNPPAGGPAPNATLVDTSSVPTTSVQTAAVAPPPPGFPDIDGFTDVSQDHVVPITLYTLATFTSPTGLQCAMWSSRGDTAAMCYGPIPGLDHPANQVYAADFAVGYFSQDTPPASDNLNGKPLASGQKVILGAGGDLMGGDQITCGVQDVVVACMVINGFRQNHGDATAKRHGFVLGPQRSWTF